MAEDWYKALAEEAVNGVSATEAVGAVLGGPAGMVAFGVSTAARAVAAAGGGSWSFDPDEIDAVLAEWKALAEELEKDHHGFLGLAHASYAPSGDMPSNEFMNSLNDGVYALEQLNMSMRDYVADFVAKLERAKNSIGESDQSKAELLGKAEDHAV
jgi:hypothetical protein